MQDEFPSQLILVEHHWLDDLSTSWTNGRKADFYDAGGLPLVILDGHQHFVGADYCSVAAEEYRTAVEQRLDDTGGVSPVRIHGSHLIQDPPLTVALTATFVLEEAVALGDVHAFLLILEDEVADDTDIYNDVTRVGYEEAITLLNPGDFATVTTEFAVGEDWNLDLIKPIAFLQRVDDNMEVYQAARLRAAADVPEEVIATAWPGIQSVAPNPFSIGSGSQLATIRLRIPEGQTGTPVGLELLDSSGRSRGDLLPRRALVAGTTQLTWDGTDARGHPLGTGVYFLRLRTQNGIQEGARIVLVQ